MRLFLACFVFLSLALPQVSALTLPWEKEGGKKGAEALGPPKVTAAEFVYRLAMDELHERVGGDLRVGDPKISPKEVRVHISVKGEGATDLVFVEKENDGRSAVVVVGPPESEGDVYRIVREGDSWKKEGADAPMGMEEDGRMPIDPEIAGVAEAFFAALKAGDAAKAYAMTSPLYRERVDEKGFRAFVGRWPVLREHGIAGVVGARNHRGVGLAEVELHVSELVIHKAHIECDEVDGKWQVGVIEISGSVNDPSPKSEQSPSAFIGDPPPPAEAGADAAAKRVMALPEVGKLAEQLKAEPKRFGAPVARAEEAPSDEQQKQYGFRFHGIAVGYDDVQLARFMTWQRFGVDAATGEVRAYDVAEDKYVPLEAWRQRK